MLFDAFIGWEWSCYLLVFDHSGMLEFLDLYRVLAVFVFLWYVFLFCVELPCVIVVEDWYGFSIE